MRCNAVAARTNTQCTNHAVSPGTFCQAHKDMPNTPQRVAQAAYRGTVPKSASRKGNIIRANTSHRALITKARKRYQELPAAGPNDLAMKYGGNPTWWSRILIHETDLPKYLQHQCVAQLIRYLDKTEEQVVEQEETVQAADSLPTLSGNPSLDELHEAWRNQVTAPATEHSADVILALPARMDRLELIVTEVLQHMTREI
ncbi:hypothetical protein LCGC14_0820080 [marine sediment metagenome]|uniref:Uncharacterized protein n=1 Tax=marine sediment metagenome TaxID=412755 RepID=A0A0F9SRP6_9ZZZZ